MKRIAFLSVVVLGVLTSSAQAEDPVYFADAQLKALVEAQLGVSDPTPSDMLGLTFLQNTYAGVTNLTGLEYATNLTYLYLELNEITDISSLAGLTGLTRLHLGHNQISDISALSGLTNLDKLTLYDNNGISDLSPLSSLTRLTTLYVNNNDVSDISTLSNLTQLTELGISGNPISDISPVGGMTNLTALYMSSAQISDISPVAGLTRLTLMSSSYNQISDISVLAGLEEMELLYLHNNQVSDISPLTGLTHLSRLDLEHNSLNNDAYCIYLPQIRDNNPGIDLAYSVNLNCPSNVSASDGAYVDKIEVTWDGICGDGHDVYYFVYRAESPEGLKTIIAGGQFSTSFQDTTAFPEVTYYYWVRARVFIRPDYFEQTDYSSYDTGWRADSVVSHTLTTSSTSGGTVTTPGEGVFSYTAGSSVSVQAAAQTNYHFTGWSGTAVTAGKVADPIGASTTVKMEADYTLIAKFVIDQHTLTISSTDGGSVTAPGEGAFLCDHGSTIAVEAVGEAGCPFAGWTGTAVDAGKVANPNAAGTTVTIDADYTLVANFTLGEHTLTVSSSAGGRVIDPEEGWHSYPRGTEVQLEAEADPGYYFSHWSGGSFWSDSNPVTLTMDQDYEIMANFSVNHCVLTISSAEGGSVAVPGEGVFTFTQGTEVRAVAVPDNGYCFAGWSGTLVETGSIDALDVGRVEFVLEVDSTLQACFAPALKCVYVDDNVAGDPGEDGTWDHPFDTIQEAIDVSYDGEAVLVLPGTYYENIVFSGKRITLSSLDANQPGAISQTTIHGGDLGSVVTFDAGESANSVLAGFTIVGGSAERGGGVRCVEASPVIANCLIAGNRADFGGGISLWDSGATLVNCTISDNFGRLDGGGVYCTGPATIANSILWSNQPQQILTESAEGLLVTYSDVQGSWPGTENIDAAPCFAAPGRWVSIDDLASPVEPSDVTATWIHGDYHLKSRQGRWDPTQALWIPDTIDSPCIDAGNPSIDVKAEALPNGGRINAGAFGGTAEASQSQLEETGE